MTCRSLGTMFSRMRSLGKASRSSATGQPSRKYTEVYLVAELQWSTSVFLLLGVSWGRIHWRLWHYAANASGGQLSISKTVWAHWNMSSLSFHSPLLIIIITEWRTDRRTEQGWHKIRPPCIGARGEVRQCKIELSISHLLLVWVFVE